MLSKTESVANGILNPAEPINTKLLLSDEEVFKHDVSGSVMDGPNMESNDEGYTVYKERWLMLAFFVLYSASNSLQWTQYTIISDIIVKYYGVTSNVVSWTSMVYMVTYVPLIFPASWMLDKTVTYKAGTMMKDLAYTAWDTRVGGWPSVTNHLLSYDMLGNYIHVTSVTLIRNNN